MIPVRHLAGIGLLLLTLGCSGREPGPAIELPGEFRELDNVVVYPADAEPRYEVELTREAHFGSTEEVLIFRPTGPAVDDSGRVFIGNNETLTIHVFQPDGSYLTSFGRDGRGPGEFKSINAMIVRSGQLHVYDVDPKRMQTFSMEIFEDTGMIYLIPENVEDYPGLYQMMSAGVPLHIREDGSYLVLYQQFAFPRAWVPDEEGVDGYHRYYSVSSDGRRLTEEVLVQKFPFLLPGFNVRHESFENAPLFAVSDNGVIFSGWSENVAVRVSDSRGRYSHAFYYPMERRPLTREAARRAIIGEERDDLDEEDLRGLRQVSLPDYWPVISSIQSDDEDRLWVSLHGENSAIRRWWVLDRQGALLAQFEWPGDRPIAEIKNGSLYARETDEMGVVSFVKYRLEMNER